MKTHRVVVEVDTPDDITHKDAVADVGYMLRMDIKRIGLTSTYMNVRTKSFNRVVGKLVAPLKRKGTS